MHFAVATGNVSEWENREGYVPSIMYTSSIVLHALLILSRCKLWWFYKTDGLIVIWMN